MIHQVSKRPYHTDRVWTAADLWGLRSGLGVSRCKRLLPDAWNSQVSGKIMDRRRFTSNICAISKALFERHPEAKAMIAHITLAPRVVLAMKDTLSCDRGTEGFEARRKLSLR